jgi:hypothetical protein
MQFSQLLNIVNNGNKLLNTSRPVPLKVRNEPTISTPISKSGCSTNKPIINESPIYNVSNNSTTTDDSKCNDDTTNNINPPTISVDTNYRSDSTYNDKVDTNCHSLANNINDIKLDEEIIEVFTPGALAAIEAEKNKAILLTHDNLIIDYIVNKNSSINIFELGKNELIHRPIKSDKLYRLTDRQVDFRRRLTFILCLLPDMYKTPIYAKYPIEMFYTCLLNHTSHVCRLKSIDNNQATIVTIHDNNIIAHSIHVNQLIPTKYWSSEQLSIIHNSFNIDLFTDPLSCTI